MSSKNLKVILLVAGEGTRLRPFTLDRPKCMVEIDGKSLLDRQLDVLRDSDLDNFVLITGYRAEKIPSTGVKKILNPYYFETNMVSSLFCAEDELDDGAIVSYGDIVYSKKTVQALLESSADISVTIDLDWKEYWKARNEDYLSDAETLKLDSSGQIIELGARPKDLSEIQGQYMGLVKYSARGAQVLRDIYYSACESGKLGARPIKDAYMTDLIQAVIDSGFPVQSVPVKGQWVEIDSVSDLNLPITRERLEFIAEGLKSS